MKRLHYGLYYANYTKSLARLERSIRTGRFTSYTQHKKQQVWDRLCRYARQLGITIKASVAAVCVAAGVSIASPASGQVVFTQQTGAANPLGGVTGTSETKPIFVDIDNDGDLDAFAGTFFGVIRYFRNSGTATSPTYMEETGAGNPLDGVALNFFSAPAFVDIDNDGDQDVVIGDYYGAIRFYRNTGTASSPIFIEETGGSNPVNGINVGYQPSPTFVDIDNDGDQDLFLGTAYGDIIYYQNTGTASAPVFVQQTGISNPFNGINVGGSAVPAFSDLDGDGDMEAMIGRDDGTISYYLNTGTASIPVFTVQAGAANPLNGVDVGSRSKPAFADVNGDAKSDLFVGSWNIDISYFLNGSILLPLRLLSFTADKQSGHNLLQWKTSDEENTKWFELERSSDGSSFNRIATVNARNFGDHTYSYADNVVNRGKTYYRMRMVDIDGRFTYSQTIWLDTDENAGIVIYPVPATDVLNINAGAARVLNTYAHIYDINGRLLQSILISKRQLQINLTSFTPGMYMIEFTDGSVQRFLKR